MNEILNSFSSPAWWFSAVVVALIINILSAYLKLPMDKILLSVSATWRSRNAIAKARHQEQVVEVSRSSDLQIIYLLKALTHRSKSNGWLIVSVINGMFLFADLQIRMTELSILGARSVVASPWFQTGTVMGLLGLYAIVCSMRCAYAAQDCEQIVKEARVHLTQT